MDAVNLMDMSEFRKRLKDPRGARGYDPAMIVNVFLYAMCKKVGSSRRIAQLCLDDLGARFLVAGSPPKFRCLAKFRHDNSAALSHLLAQTVILCDEAGLIDTSEMFGDGTKIKANASLRKNVPYENIDKAIAKIEQQILDLFSEADTLDAQEDAIYGPDNDGFSRSGLHDGEDQHERDLMLMRREQLLAAKKRLEENAQREYDDHLSKPASQRTHHKAPTGKPEPSDRANLTDPDSSIMTTWEKGYVQSYNCQIVVEKRNHIIIGAFVTNAANDYHQLTPAFDAVKETTGEYPVCYVADTGYFSARNIEEADKYGIEVLIPPKKMDRREAFEPNSALSAEQLAKLDAANRMTAKLATQEGHDIYQKRMCTVEPTFAMIKGCPGNDGFRQFLHRGIPKCDHEWSLICAVHNLRRYFACTSRTQPVQRPKTKTKAYKQYTMALQSAQ